MMNNIDYNSLRNDLIEYFGTALRIYPIAIIEISKIELASNSDLLEIAINNGFNISDYEILTKTNKLDRDLY